MLKMAFGGFGQQTQPFGGELGVGVAIWARGVVAFAPRGSLKPTP